MGLPAGAALPPIKCDYCAERFGTHANKARHVQASHKNESRLFGAGTTASVVEFVFGPFGAGGDAPPALLDADAAAAELPTASPPQFALNVDAEAAGEDDGMPALVTDAVDDDGQPPSANLDAADGGPPPLISDTEGDDDEADHRPLRPCAISKDYHDGDSSDGGSSSTSGGTDEMRGAAEYAAFDDIDDFLNPGTGHEVALAAGASMTQHVFFSSTAARIRAYYERLPEASQSVPVVHPSWGVRPTRFNSPALHGALRFALTAGGSGLSDPDQVEYARSLRAVEREAARGSDGQGPVTSAFASDHSFLTATRQEMNRVLAQRNWQLVSIVVGGRTFLYYHRDVLQVGLDALSTATTVSFGANDHAALAGEDGVAAQLARVDLDGDDAGRVRHGSLDSDLYLLEDRSVRRIHGPDARVLGVHLHADEALVSWSGACYMFPVRAAFINVVDGGRRWVTVGYIEHVGKPTEKTPAARVATSDMRNDLFQRCIAVSLRRLVRASETGISAPVAGRGLVRLVPRVLGLVVDQPEERNFYGLMGNQCNFFCSPCLEDRRVSGGLMGIPAVERDVITTLDAQLAAAVVRADDPRPSRRRLLGEQHSALAFVPVLGAVHGLGTGAHNLYRIVSFDLLHVWKLGVLRDLAQRLPSVLAALCRGRSGARLGSVAATLDAVNLRGFHLGRNCKASPAPPGYVDLHWRW